MYTMPVPVRQMVAHLQAEVCPPGTRVWPVQNDSWLSACIDCGAYGKININKSKTDYVVLIQDAWDYLNQLVQDGVQITGEHLTSQLQHAIALYEVRWGHKGTAMVERL